MKKLLFVLSLALGLVWNAAASLPEKVYTIKSGHYVYKMSMFGFEMGNVDTWFDDYGLKTYAATSMNLMGEKMEMYVTINGKRKLTVTVSDGEKEQEISDVERDDYGDYVLLDSMSAEELGKAGIQRLEDEEVMGYHTQVYKKKTETEAGKEAWTIINVWNGIPLKASIEMNGNRMNLLELVSVETDIDVDPALFVIPETVE